MTNVERMTKDKARRFSCEDTFWAANEPPVVRKEATKARVYDLEERTAKFGEAVIDFAKSIPQNPVTNRIINQLVGAATSVGANYAEARPLWVEAKELHLIFSKIRRSKA
jgi:hypothetical protein